MVQATHDHAAAPVAPHTATAGTRLAAASALDSQIRALHQRRNEDQARLAQLLLELARSRGYLALGFSSLENYAYTRLSWGWTKVRDLLKLMERLPEMPATREEFMAGRLPWTKAVVVARAVEEAPEEEDRWLAEAQLRSAAELQRLLAAERGEPVRRRVTLELDEEQFALLQEGWRALQSEGLELDRGAATAELVRRALVGGGGGNSAFRILLSHDLESGETRQATRDGAVLLSPEQAGRVACDAELQVPSGKVTRTIPTHVRNKVRARSQDRCEVPGCGNRVGLEIHHLRGWKRGHHLNDLLHLCSAHHKAQHEGSLRVEGSRPTGLTFRRADGAVLGTVGGAAQGAAGEVEVSAAGAPAESRPEASVEVGPEEPVAASLVGSARAPEGGVATREEVEPTDATRGTLPCAAEGDEGTETAALEPATAAFCEGPLSHVRQRPADGGPRSSAEGGRTTGRAPREEQGS